MSAPRGQGLGLGQGLGQGLGRALGTGLAVAAVLIGGGAAPAGALGVVGGGGGGSTTNSGPVQVVHRCTLYANGAGFGAWCGGGESGRARTWNQILNGRPFVPCRNDPVPQGYATPPDPDGTGQWAMQTCIVDYNLDQPRGGPRAHPVTTLVWLPGPDGPGVVPGYMTWLWAAFDTAYPTPILSVGPIAWPRTNVPAFFWLAGPAATGPARTVWDGEENLTMTARLHGLQVTRVGTGESTTCAAAAKAYDPARSPFEQDPAACTLTFGRSSATQPGQAYQLRADASWEVGYTDAAGTWHSMGVFDVPSYQLLPVQDVESVVVPG